MMAMFLSVNSQWIMHTLNSRCSIVCWLTLLEGEKVSVQ